MKTLTSIGIQKIGQRFVDSVDHAAYTLNVLKDATLNNMVNNVFLINFDTVTSVAITSGIYDSVARKIYV